MYGSGMGTLKVQTQTGSENPVTLWMVSGNQGTIWHRLYKLAIPLDPNTKVTQSVMHATGIILFQDYWFDLWKLQVDTSRSNPSRHTTIHPLKKHLDIIRCKNSNLFYDTDNSFEKL